MWTIHKFPIPSGASSFALVLPENYRTLSLQVQRGVPCLWVMLDDQAEKRAYRFEVRGTGHGCEGLDLAAHVGTFMVQADSLVFHVFRILEG